MIADSLLAFLGALIESIHWLIIDSEAATCYATVMHANKEFHFFCKPYITIATKCQVKYSTVAQCT